MTFIQKSNHTTNIDKCLLCHSPKLSKEYIGLFDDRYGYPDVFDLNHCSRCDFRQLQPRFNDAELSWLYSNYYPRHNFNPIEFYKNFRFRNNLAEKIKRWFRGDTYKSFYHVPANTTVLDIGYGNGFSLFFLQALGCKVFGVEVDQQVTMKELAKRLNLHLKQGSVATVGFKDESFDVITASQVIEHIPEPIQFLQTCQRKLKPNGQLILSFPNYNSLSRYVYRRKWIHWHTPYHLNFFTNKSFAYACRVAGFTLIKCHTITPEIWSILQILKLLQPRPTKGKKARLWTEETLISKPVSNSSQLMRNIVKFGINFFNRMIDFFGLGDSYLVVLEKRQPNN